jgi:hypothetical protein
MWPTLLGSGWIWSALVAGTLACFIVAVLGFLLLITGKPRRQTSDDLETTWHRYEEGDLTRAEFERIVRRRAAGGTL